jgi:hypothetical protein
MAGEPSSTIGDQADSFPLRQLSLSPKCEALSIARSETLRDCPGYCLTSLPMCRTCAVVFYWVTNTLKTKGEFRAMPFRNISASYGHVRKHIAKHVSYRLASTRAWQKMMEEIPSASQGGEPARLRYRNQVCHRPVIERPPQIVFPQYLEKPTPRRHGANQSPNPRLVELESPSSAHGSFNPLKKCLLATPWHAGNLPNFLCKFQSQSGYCKTNDGREGQGNNGLDRDQNTDLLVRCQ